MAGITLTEFESIKELAELADKIVKKSKINSIVEPFYGQEPNITKKK